MKQKDRFFEGAVLAAAVVLPASAEAGPTIDLADFRGLVDTAGSAVEDDTRQR